MKPGHIFQGTKMAHGTPNTERLQLDEDLGHLRVCFEYLSDFPFRIQSIHASSVAIGKQPFFALAQIWPCPLLADPLC